MKHLSNSRRSRAGFTLRELSISLAFGGVVMMTAVGMVHEAFDWSTTVSHRRSDDQTFFRLSRQLRDDLVVAVDVRFGAVARAGRDVANGEDLRIFATKEASQVTASLIADADGAHRDAFARSDLTVAAHRLRGHEIGCGRGDAGSFEEVSA